MFAPDLPKTAPKPTRNVAPVAEASIQGGGIVVDSAKTTIMVVMGNDGDASSELLNFAEQLDIPVAHTLDWWISDPPPVVFGMAGMHATLGNDAIQNADVLVAVGMRFDDRVTGHVPDFAKQAKIIHIELDPKEIGKIIRPDVTPPYAKPYCANSLMPVCRTCHLVYVTVEGCRHRTGHRGARRP